MRVQDCVGDDFREDCRRLSALVLAEFSPDLVVGIERGGARVAEEMHAPGLLDCEMCTLSTARPGTSGKSHLSWLTRWAPRRLLDGLRVAEHRLRVRRSRRAAPAIRVVTATEQADARIAAAERVLVVDDAVDSGATLQAVLAHVTGATRGEVRSAALTVTFPAPVVRPDVTLHRDVLLRFPWSSDAAGAR